MPLITSAQVLERVRFHFLRIAKKKGLEPHRLLKALELICWGLQIYPEEFYAVQLEDADRIIGHRDRKDIYPLALTLKLHLPIWTNDLDQRSGLPNSGSKECGSSLYNPRPCAYSENILKEA